MAPQSNSVEVDGIDVIDVAPDSLLDPVKEQQQVSADPEQQQERRMSAMSRVRDEADGLRQEICQLRIRLEEVEEESKFHAAKANELQELLMKSNENDDIDETLLKQSEELAKKDCQIEALEKKITELMTEKALLELERDDAKKEMAEMSNVVRSLQKVATPDCSSHDGDDEDDSDDESEDSEEIVLTPETALDLTLGNLKEHIEMLEDGLQASSSLNSNQKKAIHTLEADIKAQQAQIGMLEELFRELNAADRVTEIKNRRAKEAAKAKEAASEGEANDDKSLNDSDRSSKESSATKQQETVNRLGSMFRSMRMTSSNPKPKAPKKEKRPEIPEEAAAAAQAVAFLVTNPDNVEETPKKEKSPKMKKVKIRFKKAGLEGTYTGPLVDKKPHGVGTIRFTNGNTYLGEMKRGKMSGSGTLYTKNNGVFRGLFENNKFVGESTDIDLNNDSSSSQTASDSESSLNKPCDATTTTVETDEHEEAKAKAVAALELDAFSPSNIESDQIEDSFKMMVTLEGMEQKVEMDEIRKESEREENDSFLREFAGSEHSSSLRQDMFDESNSSRAEDEQQQIDPQDVF